MWDTVTGQQVGKVLRWHKGPVYSVAFSSDGTHIVSGSDDGTIMVWDAVTGQQVGKVLRGHKGPVYSIAFSSDSIQIVSGSYDKTIRVWDAVMGQHVSNLKDLRWHKGSIYSFAFSPDRTHIVSGSDDRRIRIWNQKGVNTHPTCLQLCSDWFCFGNEETQSYILWIPHSLCHQDFICYPCNMVITACPIIAVWFEDDALGPAWARIKK